MMSLCPNNQSLETDSGVSTTVATWISPEASDNSEETPTIACSVESGSQFGIGENEVVCDALDASGNQATCKFYVNIEGDTFQMIQRFMFSLPF